MENIKTQLQQADVAQLAREIIYILERNENELIPYYSNEPRPDEIEILTHTATTQKQKQIPQPSKAKDLNIQAPVNFHCELCQARLYPVRNFFRLASGENKLPILVLHYNGAFHSQNALEAKRDLSTQFIFGGKEEDGLFERMLNKLKLHLQDFHYQEYPACHFNAHRSTAEDWQQRAEHCTKHVEATIQQHNIGRLILCGAAAIALLGKEKAKQMANKASVFPISLGNRKLTCISLRSPAALLSLEKQRSKEKEEQVRNEILQQEKAIKGNMLTAMQSIMKA